MTDNPLSVLAFIAERRIEEAIHDGDFNNIPGMGKPLALQDDSDVPEDLRMAYKILHNAGYIPQEILDRKEISRLADMLEQDVDEQEQVKRIQKLNFLLTRLRLRHGKSIQLDLDDPYYQQITERITIAQKKLKKGNNHG